MLHGDKPRQHHGKVEQSPGPPEGAPQNRPLAAQEGEGGHDQEGQKWRHRPLGQRGYAGEEVDVEEPELGAGLVPCVPAEQSDGQWRGHLHIGRGAAGKADDACAGDGDQRRVQVAAGAESPHVQVDERHHDEGEGGRGQPGGPVVHAEVLEDEHGPPVVERRLLQPGVAVEIGRDAGAQPALERVRRVEPVQHLVRDLRIAGLIGAHQAQAVAAQQRGLPIEQKKEGKTEKNGGLADDAPTGQSQAPAFGRVRSRWFLKSFHFQRFSNGADACLTQTGDAGFGQGGWGS